MCEPATIAMVAGLASTAMGTVGSLMAGSAQNAAAQNEAKTQDINARMQEERARDAVIRGNIEEKKSRERASMYASEQLAAQAANNIDTGFGSAMDLALDTARSAELDALTIRSNSYREAYDQRVGAANSRNAASSALAKGKAAKTASLFAAGGTLLSGGSSAYGNYKKATAVI